MTLFDKIQDTATFIQARISNLPKIGIVLGSGLGALAERIETHTTISYTDIPHFPVSTVKGHGGKLLFGKLGGKEVMLMSGRFHFYEGYNMQEVTFPIRVMKALGVEVVMLSNAAGGTNPLFDTGDLMIIKDHINLLPEHPLRGPNDERLGTRFPDMSKAYDHDLVALAQQTAAGLGISLRTGVYAGLQGPSFETPAEYKWINTIGGDAVGMSTVPETIVARHAGMRVFAMSVITNVGFSDRPMAATHEEVLEAADAASQQMATLFTEMLHAL